jgi:hypothetical protein
MAGVEQWDCNMAPDELPRQLGEDDELPDDFGSRIGDTLTFGSWSYIRAVSADEARHAVLVDEHGDFLDTLASDPDALHGSFQLYRAFPATMAQNEQRKTRRLTLPVLAIGGAESSGEGPYDWGARPGGKPARPCQARLEVQFPNVGL